MKPRATCEEIIEALGLSLHPEGGCYKETYRSDERVLGAALPDRFEGDRSLSTAIYYMITAASFSAMHRIDADEIFHFYAGDPVRMLQLDDEGGRVFTLGPAIHDGMSPQVLVPAGTWQGLRLHDGGDYALLGCTVAPGFEFSGFELADRSDLAADYPDHADEIRRLTST